jgi:ribose-phosphate pyrophosphokinase
LFSLQNDTVIISSIDNLDLANKIGDCLDLQVLQPNLKIFSDGESKIQLDSVSSKKCVIIHSTHPPVDQHLMQLFMIIHKCNTDHAQNIHVINPYMGYSRQDKEFIKGEVITIELIGKILEIIGTNRLVTIDIHNPNILTKFNFKADNISAIPLLAQYILKYLKSDNLLVISPDTGGVVRAKQLASIIESDVLYLTKTRDKYTGEVTTRYEGTTPIHDRDVILIDDIISTGHSIINAVKILKQLGCKKIFVLCTHALLLENAAQKLLTSGVNEIIATNSVPNPFAKVDLSSILSQNISTTVTAGNAN